MEEYAMYKGETFIAMGTMKELAALLNVKLKTIYFYTTPAYKKRCRKGEKRRILIKL